MKKINSIRISFRFNIHNDRNCKCKCRGAEVKLEWLYLSDTYGYHIRQ